MYAFEFVVPETTDIGLVVNQILEMELVENCTILNRIRWDL